MKPEYIILHHSLTKDSGTVSWQAIRRYHVQECRWEDIGYHFGLERVKGDVEVLCGRPLNIQGAHCLGMNRRSLGVCFVGNYDEVSVPHEMWQRGLKLVKGLCDVANIPIANVRGHRDYAKKTCPGLQFSVDQFRKDLYLL